MRALLGLLLVVCCSWTASADEAWQASRHLWEDLLPDRGRVLHIAGGDINGDMKDDVVVTYDERSEHTMIALVTAGEEYIVAPFDERSAEFLTKSDVAAFEAMEVDAGLIHATMDFDPSRIARELVGFPELAPATFSMQYRAGAIRLVDVVTSGKVGAKTVWNRAHLFYDVDSGEIFYRYLNEREVVGEAGSYIIRRYTRTVAQRIDQLRLNGDTKKWYVIANPQRVRNGPVGVPVRYGFEGWESHKDLSGEYFAAHDEKHVYLLVAVTDDRFRQHFSGDMAVLGDHIELWFGDEAGNRYQIALSPGDFDSIHPEALLWYDADRAVRETPLSSVAIVSRKTEEGYIVEARIPARVFGKDSVRALTRFTLALSDSDYADQQESLLATSSLVWAQSESLGEIVWR